MKELKSKGFWKARMVMVASEKKMKRVYFMKCLLGENSVGQRV